MILLTSLYKTFQSQKMSKCILSLAHNSRAFDKEDPLISLGLLISSFFRDHTFFYPLAIRSFLLTYLSRLWSFLQSLLNISINQYSIFHTFVFLFSPGWVFIYTSIVYITTLELTIFKYLLQPQSLFFSEGLFGDQLNVFTVIFKKQHNSVH